MKIIFKMLSMKTYNFLILFIVVAVITFSACTKADYNDNVVKGDPPPVSGGYTNSNQVAASSLLDYWSFNDSKGDSVSNISPIIDSNSSYVQGIEGNALHLSNGYLLYPTISALSKADAVSSVSVSLWFYIPGNNGSTFSELFTLARDTTKETDWLDILNVGIETGQSVSNSFTDLHSWIGTYPMSTRNGGDNINDYGAAGTDYQVFNGANKWVHYVMRYDATTEDIDLFANNVRVSNNNFRNRNGLGPIVSPTPTQVLFGAFANSSSHFPLSATLGFHGFLNGSIDEVRIYSKALSDAEINALYQLQRQGR